jgi:hypothetical protein
MLKLYKKIDGVLHYWETWDDDEKTGIIHSGIVGERGVTRKIKSDFFTNVHKKVQKEVNGICKDGFVEAEEEYTLLIEFIVDGMGSDADIEKRTRLQDRMNETLGWTGLGYCDGGSIGSGTMEVCCFVVDFDIAKQTIIEDLKNTEFENYTRIYDEDAE